MKDILIKTADVNTSKSGNKYLNMTIVFENKEYNAKYWDYIKLNNNIQKVLKTELPGVFSVKMKENYFNKNKQYIIEKFYKFNNDLDRILEFVEQTELDKKTMKDILLMINKTYKLKLKDLILDKRFLNYPAASNNHHNYNGGLLEHTYTMLLSAKFLMNKFYDFLDKRLVYAGIILHDYCKIYDFQEKEAMLGLGVYNDNGKLIGHISKSMELLTELDYEDKFKMKLKHIILAHHKNKKWGSPVEPQTPEAWFVHLLDYTDSKMNMCKKAIDKYENGWTSKIMGLNYNKLFLN